MLNETKIITLKKRRNHYFKECMYCNCKMKECCDKNDFEGADYWLDLERENFCKWYDITLQLMDAVL